MKVIPLSRNFKIVLLSFIDLLSDETKFVAHKLKGKLGGGEIFIYL